MELVGTHHGNCSNKKTSCENSKGISGRTPTPTPREILGGIGFLRDSLKHSWMNSCWSFWRNFRCNFFFCLERLPFSAFVSSGVTSGCILGETTGEISRASDIIASGAGISTGEFFGGTPSVSLEKFLVKLLDESPAKSPVWNISTNSFEMCLIH